MSTLSAEEIAEFREIFNLVDKDRRGHITRAELTELMDTLGIDSNEEDMDDIINELETDTLKTGEISFKDFTIFMSRKVNSTYTSDQVKIAFHVFEGSGCPPGYVKSIDLIKALTTYGTSKLSEHQAADLVRQLDADQNGLIDYNNFVSMMMNT